MDKSICGRDKKLFEVNKLRSTESYLAVYIKEGAMYLIYPLALLAGIGFYFMMNYVDQDIEIKTSKVDKTT